MAKRLTIIGVLAAVVIGALTWFSGNASAGPCCTDIQHFDISGAFEVDAVVCYDGARPSTPIVAVPANPCGAGSSSTAAPAGATIPAYSVNRIPPGDRLSLAITVAPSTWPATTYACGPTVNNACNGDVKAAESTSGNVYAEANLFCHGITSSPYNADILADPSSTPPAYVPIDFKRSAQQSGVNGGTGPLTPGGAPGSVSGDYSYIEQVQPFPTSWTFIAQDSADLTGLFLGGAAPAFPLAPAVPLILYTRQSAYGTNPYVTYVQLAGSTAPPDDQYLCTDSPQNSIVETTVTTPATPGLYPRVVLYTSAADHRSRRFTRIADHQCVNIGGFAGADADGDCLPDSAEPAGPCPAGNPNPVLNPDCDGDGLQDGIEVAIGTSPTAADADADGANDYTELFQYTNPANPDTDGDGSKDLADNGSDENLSLSGVQDTTNDDNCPAVANPTQTNTDSGATYHGIPNPWGAPATGDNSNPDEDTFGDACDTDKDNDGFNDAAEAAYEIVAWTGPTGVGKTVCKRSGTGGTPTSSSALDGDVDRDLYLDGIECSQRARPDLADRTIASCSTSPVDPDGCAQPQNGAALTGDSDGDRLAMPLGAGSHGLVEIFYRTQSIALDSAGNTANDIEACPAGMCKAAACGTDSLVGTSDSDSDCDVLQDGAEVNFYGTSPASPDTDQDGCSDGREAADVTGDFNVTAGDLGSVASKFGSYRNANGTINLTAAGYGKVNFDFNKDGNITGGDLGSLASYFGSCPAKSGPVTQNLSK